MKFLNFQIKDKTTFWVRVAHGVTLPNGNRNKTRKHEKNSWKHPQYQLWRGIREAESSNNWRGWNLVEENVIKELIMCTSGKTAERQKSRDSFPKEEYPPKKFELLTHIVEPSLQTQKPLLAWKQCCEAQFPRNAQETSE